MKGPLLACQRLALLFQPETWLQPSVWVRSTGPGDGLRGKEPIWKRLAKLKNASDVQFIQCLYGTSSIQEPSSYRVWVSTAVPCTLFHHQLLEQAELRGLETRASNSIVSRLAIKPTLLRFWLCVLYNGRHSDGCNLHWDLVRFTPESVSLCKEGELYGIVLQSFLSWMRWTHQNSVSVDIMPSTDNVAPAPQRRHFHSRKCDAFWNNSSLIANMHSICTQIAVFCAITSL